MFAKLDTIKKNVSGIKKMVRQYQPKREKKILIGLTEWNCKLFEDENTADLFSGLWTAAAFGEMFESEIDYATHWDSFTVKETGGGHGFMLQDTAEPLAQFRFLEACAPDLRVKEREGRTPASGREHRTQGRHPGRNRSGPVRSRSRGQGMAFLAERIPMEQSRPDRVEYRRGGVDRPCG
jgi:hypothetical protein